MIKIRLGNEMLESLYWREEDERSYKICGSEEET